MGLVLKHVVQTQAGTWHYRRRLPKDVAEVEGRKEFKKLLGATEREALKKFPKVNAEFERQIEEVRRRKSGIDAEATALEIHREAQRLARQMAEGMVFVGGRAVPASHPEAAELIRESYLSSLPRGANASSDPVKVHAVNLLANAGQLPRPEPTLADAKRLYLAERVKGDINEKAKQTRIDRATARLAAASVEEARTIASLTREDARNVRDYLLRDLGMKPATARRMLNDIRAIVALGIGEFDLGGVTNPFVGLPIKLETVARDERLPIPEDMLEKLGKRISSYAMPTLWHVWRIVEGTGCRYWNHWAPPCGWNCRCTLQSLSQRDIDRMIREGEQLMFVAPQETYRNFTNKRTGEIVRVPDGIDPGWAYNPGRIGYEARVNQAVAEKVADAPLAFVAAAVEERVASTAFERFVADPRGSMPVMAIQPELAAAIGAELRVAVLPAETMLKQKASFPELTIEDYRSIPSIGVTASLVFRDKSRTFILTRAGAGRWRYVALKAARSAKAAFITSFRYAREETILRLLQTEGVEVLLDRREQ